MIFGKWRLRHVNASSDCERFYVERMTRLELATYAMARRRSSQLSYIRLNFYE